MGAMVLGTVNVERLQFNEKTLWTGGPGAKQGYDFGIPNESLAGKVRDVSKQIEVGTRLTPENVAKQLGQPIRGYGDYQSFGEVVLKFGDALRPVEQYRRELDIDNGVARVFYVQEGVRFTREYFASYPDGVIVVRLTADRPNQISVRVGIDVPDNRTRRTHVSSEVSSGRVTVAGALLDNQLEYAAQLNVRAQN